MDLAELGIRIDSASAVSGVSNLDRLTDAASRAEVATEKLATTSTGAAGGFKMASGGGRLLAMQLSQVAQQGAATGQYLQAIAIQGADIGMMFGVWGTVIGTVAGVALPFLMQALGGTTDSAARTQEQIEGLRDAVQAYRDAVDAASVPNETLIEQYGRMAEAARVALQAQADMAMVQALQQTEAAIQAVTDALLRQEIANARSGATKTVLAEGFGLAADEASRLVRAVQALDSANGLEAQAEAALEIQRQLRLAFGSVSAMPGPLQTVYGQMSDIVLAAGETNAILSETPGIIGGISSAASSASSAINAIGSAAQSAYGAVAALAGKLYEAAQYRATGAGTIEAYDLGAQMANYGRGRAQGEALAASGYSLPAAPGSGGGGGGGGVDPYQADLEALVASLEAKTETVQSWYEESRAMLADHRAQEILGTQQHQEAMIALEAEYQSRMSEIQGQAQQQRISDVGGFFGALAGVASAGGQRMVKIVAAFEAAQGIMNAYGAYLRALNSPVPMTPWGRAAAALNVLGAGLRGVMAIKQAGGIGGSVGSTGGGAIAAQGATTQAPQGSMLTIAGINRNDLLTGEMLEGIIDGIAKIGPIRGVRLIGAA